LTAIDLTGERFGMLTALECVEKTRNGTKWLCRCDCGQLCVVLLGNLRGGKQKSCGCLRHREAHNRTHGESRSARLYRIWTGMKTRCDNPSRKAYPQYGGRGISVCSEWANSYEAFRDWALRSGYADDLSIDRIDNNGNYEPANCRWATREQQSNNRRSNRLITANGATKTMAEWARESGIRYTIIYKRLKHGWSEEKAVLTPVKRSAT
jgi:hypothetical protein